MAANSILKLRVESEEYDSKLKKAAEGIRHLAEVAHKSGGELTGLEKAELDYIKALGEMDTKSKTAAGSTRELESAFKELTVIYNQLNDVEKADEGGKALAASLETIKQRAIDARSQLDVASQSLQANESAAQQDSSILEQLSSKFTVNIDAIKLFNLGLQASKAVLDTAKDAFFNNEENLDEWGRTVESIESVYRGFLNSINSGDFSGFLSSIQTITKAARDAYDALDELATFTAFNKANIAGARADLTGSIADFREGKGNKDAVSQASEALIKELQQKQKLQEEAYKKVIAKVAAERGVKEGDLLKVMTGNYGTFKELKDLQFTGKKTTMVATGGTFTSGPTYRQVTEAVPANEREKLAQAIKHLNDTEIDNFQSLAEAAKMTSVEINNQRKMVARVLNGKQGSGGGGGGGGGGRTSSRSTQLTPAQQAEVDISKAQKDYADAINDAKVKVEEGIMTEDDQDKAILSAKEQLSNAYLKAYNATGDSKYLEAQKEVAESMVFMKGVIEQSAQEQKLLEKQTRELNEAEKKLHDEMEKRRDLEESWKTPTQNSMASLKSDLQKRQSTAELGSSSFNKLQTNIVDITTLQSIINTQIKNGLTIDPETTKSLMSQIINGDDIDPAVWEDLQNKINEQLAKMGKDIKPLNIDLKTGNIVETGKQTEKSWRGAATAMSSVNSALQQMEDPSAKIVGIVGQAIANIALGFAQATASDSKLGVFGWIAAIAGGLATMISTIESIHSATGYQYGGVVKGYAQGGAVGGVVQGTTYSGDQIPIMANAGEVVLTRAMAGNLASQLEGAGAFNSLELTTVIGAEDIKLVLNNRGRRTGKGEYVQSKFRRS